MFDWDRFKNGEFVVTFGKEEDAKDFLKECDKRNIKWRDGTKATDFENFWNGNSNLYFEFSKLPNGICYGRTNLRAIEERMIVKWEVKEMKELTFKEVIANIKENEVWESTYSIVSKLENRIDIEVSGNCKSIGIGDTVKFKLRRKEYTFEEAFKAYESGKEIESILTGDKFIKSKRADGSDFDSFWDEGIKRWWRFLYFELELIRGKWYIND